MEVIQVVLFSISQVRRRPCLQVCWPLCAYLFPECLPVYECFNDQNRLADWINWLKFLYSGRTWWRCWSLDCRVLKLTVCFSSSLGLSSSSAQLFIFWFTNLDYKVAFHLKWDSWQVFMFLAQSNKVSSRWYLNVVAIGVCPTDVKVCCFSFLPVLGSFAVRVAASANLPHINSSFLAMCFTCGSALEYFNECDNNGNTFGDLHKQVACLFSVMNILYSRRCPAAWSSTTWTGTVCPGLIFGDCCKHQPDYWHETATFSLSLSLPPLSTLYLARPSLWSMPGVCAAGAAVFVSVQLRLWMCYHVYCALVWRWRVFVCVHTRLALLWSLMQCCLWTEEPCMSEAGVKALRAFAR